MSQWMNAGMSRMYLVVCLVMALGAPAMAQDGIEPAQGQEGVEDTDARAQDAGGDDELLDEDEPADDASSDEEDALDEGDALDGEDEYYDDEDAYDEDAYDEDAYDEDAYDEDAYDEDGGDLYGSPRPSGGEIYLSEVQEDPPKPPTPTLALSEGFAWNANIRLTSFKTPDMSMQAFGANRTYLGGQYEFGVDLGKMVLPGLRASALFATGGYEKVDLFDGAATLDWQQNFLMVAADWGPELWGFFRPAVRVGGGWAWQELQLTADHKTVGDTAHGLAGFASIQFEFFTGPRFLGPFALKAFLESGVLGQTATTFERMREDPPSDKPWTQEDVALGELRASGIFGTAGIALGMDF